MAVQKLTKKPETNFGFQKITVKNIRCLKIALEYRESLLQNI